MYLPQTRATHDAKQDIATGWPCVRRSGCSKWSGWESQSTEALIERNHAARAPNVIGPTMKGTVYRLTRRFARAPHSHPPPKRVPMLALFVE